MAASDESQVEPPRGRDAASAGASDQVSGRVPGESVLAAPAETRRLFGTDGVRGTANVEPVTAETTLRLGRAMAYVLRQEVDSSHRHRVVVGKDTRLSGYLLESAMLAGLTSMGVDVLLVGPLPTPGIAYITRSLRADAGVALTASHNSYEDNGIKFFNRDGYKLPGAIERRIEELVITGEIDHIRPTRDKVGKAFRIDDALGRYVEYAKRAFPRGMTLEGMRVVVDAAHGAAYKSSPCVLRELGAEVVVCNNEPDGTNINRNCGSTYPAALQRAVIDHGADLGIAHDGDGDRVIISDETAQILNGDRIMALVALDFMRRGRLKDRTLVATVMSNHGLDRVLARAGGRVVRAQVGDRFVLEKMLEIDANVGGEPSGHIIFRDYSTSGDGIITALQVMRIMRQSGRRLSLLARCMEPLPQFRLDVPVARKLPFEQVPALAALLDEVGKEIAAREGYLLVRYSGTEPKARILIEGGDELPLDDYGQRLAAAIHDHLGGAP